MDKYTELLKNKSISPSIQRVKVLQYLDKNRVHPTVEQIYTGIKGELPTLSKTTVYNVLQLLEEKKVIKSISGSDGREHYDFCRFPHGHFKCVKCGNVYDVDENFVYQGQPMIDGHKISDYNLIFKGTCRNCLDKMEAKNDK